LTLETARLLLRPPEEADLDALAAMYSDPLVTEFVGARTREETAEWITRQHERHAADGFGMLTVVRKEDGAVLGRAGLLVWDRRSWAPTTLRDAGNDGEVETGWVFAREHWGNGYATEAATASRDYALHELGRERAIALIAHDNIRSVRVARRLGMSYDRDVRMFNRNVVQLYTVTA
jgi:[ribosomal protein S5]-alanine N-acetyltransferase